MRSILSTKKLSPAQKELALNGKLRLVEYDAIQVRPLPFQIEAQFDCLVFTSQNAVQSFLERKRHWHRSKEFGQGLQAVCVGEKTKRLLEEHGFQVLASASNAKDLGQLIVTDYHALSFVFLSGNRSLHTLATILKHNKVRFKEIVVYETVLRPKRFHRQFDAVLFYSPSGVESFVAQNDLSKSMAICIGPTTLSEAKKHTSRFIQANRPTVENVIVQAVTFASGLH